MAIKVESRPLLAAWKDCCLSGLSLRVSFFNHSWGLEVTKFKAGDSAQTQRAEVALWYGAKLSHGWEEGLLDQLMADHLTFMLAIPIVRALRPKTPWSPIWARRTVPELVRVQIMRAPVKGTCERNRWWKHVGDSTLMFFSEIWVPWRSLKTRPAHIPQKPVRWIGPRTWGWDEYALLLE